MIKHLYGLADRASPKFRRTVGNFGWLFLDRMLRIGVGMVVGVWVTRYLGPEQFGIFNYALAFVAMFGALATLGLDTIVVRDIVREPDKQDEILGTAFALRLGGALLTIAISLGAAFVMRPQDPLVLAIIAIIATGLLAQSLDVIDYWFQARIQSKYVVYVRNIAFFVTSAAKVSFILLGAPLIAFAWVTLAEVVLASIGLIYIYRRHADVSLKWRVTLARARVLLKSSLPLLLAAFALSIQTRIDQILIGQMLGNEELGQYIAALRLVEFMAFVPVILHNSLAPVAAHRKVENEGLYFDLLLNLYRLLVILSGLLCIPAFFFADHIIHLFYGTAYLQAGLLLALSCFRLFCTSLGMVRSLYITNESLFNYALFTSILGCVVGVAANFILIPKYSVLGAIYASYLPFIATVMLADVLYAPMRRNAMLMFHAILTPWKFRI